MKFALFATTAFAASLVQRDVNAILSDISAIQTATTNLDDAIKAITGPSSKNAVLSANSALLSAINKGISDTKSTSDLTQTQALEIATPIGNLASQVSSTISDLISKKSIIVSSGLGGTTENQLTEVQSATEAFSSDLTALVPTALQSTAQALSAQILEALASGVAAFKGLSDSTGSSSTAAAASTTAAASSTAAAVSSSVSSVVSSVASSVSSAVSAASSVVSSAAASSTYAAGNMTTSAAPSSTAAYTGAAATNVASFGGLVAAAAAIVAAL